MSILVYHKLKFFRRKITISLISSPLSLIWKREFSVKNEERIVKRQEYKKKRQSSCRKLLFLFGVPDRNRTCGLKSRSLALYPTELRIQIFYHFILPINRLLHNCNSLSMLSNYLSFEKAWNISLVHSRS